MTTATLAPLAVLEAAGLLDNDRTIGEMEQLTYDRIIHAHETWETEKGYTFSLEAGNRVIEFVERYCRHYKGEWSGSSMLLAPWQKLLILETFGWFRPDGYRLHRTLWIEVARKNGKSQLAAALGVYLLVADGEPGAEVFATATKRDQARIVFDAAKAIVNQSPELRKHVQVQRANLHVLRTHSKFEPLSSEGHSLDGLSPHGNIVDELHSHRSRVVWDKLTTGMGSRRQPLTVCITTAGLYDPTQVGYQLHSHATAILEKMVEDDSWFVWISSADEDDDPYEESTWEKANPNIGVSIYPSFLKQRASEALSQPSSYNSFQRLHLNRWTSQSERWLDMSAWGECDAEVDMDALLGRECFAGLDLSSKLDLTALALVFPPVEDDLWRLWVRCYMPRSSMVERERVDHTPFSLWERQGWITPTDGDVIDYDYIVADIDRLSTDYALLEVAYDPWAAQQTALKLRDDYGIPVVPMRQGYRSLSEPSKELERLIIARRLAHGGNNCLTWQMSNASVSHDPASNIKPDKSKQTAKIDAVVASIMAIGRATLLADQGSVYEDEGILVI